MDVTTFQSHIAYSAGQSKSTNIMAGAKAIIDILKRAELIIEKDGQLIPSDEASEIFEPIQPDQEQTAKPIVEEQQNRIQLNQVQVPTTSGNVSISVQINLEVKAEELDGLGLKVRKLLEELSGNSVDNGISNQ